MFPARPVLGRSALTAARGHASSQTFLAEHPGPADNAQPMSSSAARLEPPIPFFIPTGDYRWDRSRGIVFANPISSPKHVSIHNTTASPTQCLRRHVATNRPPPPLPRSGSSKPSATLRAVDANARPTTKPVSKTNNASQDERYQDELDERRKLRAQVQQDAGRITELERRLGQATREAKQWQDSSIDLQAELSKERAARQAEVARIQDTHSKKLSAKDDLIRDKDAEIRSLVDRLKSARVTVRNEIIQEAHAEGLRVAEEKHEERHRREMRDNLKEVEELKSQSKREVDEELKRGKERLDGEAQQNRRELDEKRHSNQQELAERHRANQQELAERHRAMRAEVSQRERQAARELAEARRERQEAEREREESQEKMREKANKTARSELLARQLKIKEGYRGYREAVQSESGSMYYYSLDSQAGKLREQSDEDKAFGKGLQTIPAQIQSRVPDFSGRYTILQGALDKHAEAQIQSLDNSMPTLDQYDQNLRRGRLYGVIAHTSRQITHALRYTVPNNRDMAKLTVEADILWPLDVRQKAIERELTSSPLSRNQNATQERRAAQLVAVRAVTNTQQEITEYEELLHAPYAEKVGVVSRLEHTARYRHVLDNYKGGRSGGASDEEMDQVREHIAEIRREQADLNHIMHRRGRLEGLLGIQDETDEERINAAIKEHLKELEAQLLSWLDKVGEASRYDVTRVQRKAGKTKASASASASASGSPARSTSTFKATAKRASPHVAFTSALSASDISRIWPAALPPAQYQEERHQCAVTLEMSPQHRSPPPDVPLSEPETSMRGDSDPRHQRSDGAKDPAYSITPEDFQAAVSAPQTSPAAFWSYKLYRSPAGATPVLHYCTKFDQAEEQAQKFLGAAVLGFDIEWESGASIAKSRIKDNVSLIQIATEDRIGLFQLGLFKGDTMEELMPPSLRTILESPATIKAGVNIAGDATRLRTCLGVNMCGLIELSHLYRIVRYSEKNPAQVNRRLVAMAEQVQDVLRLPLSKDTTVRTGAWSRKLNVQQCDYAGSDAYAGLQLYYELESQREKMQPTPPRPAFYELFQPLVLGDGTEIPAVKTSRPRASAKAGIVGDEADADEAYFDAVESLEGLKLVEDEDATQLEDRPIRYPSLPVDVVRDLARSSSISQPVSAPKPTADKAKRQPPPKSAEVDRADSWMEEWKASLSSGYKLDSSDQKLRAYHLWHEQGLDVKQVGAKIGDPPLANMTVAKYVLDVVKDEGLAYDAERIKQPLNMIPMYLRWRFQKIAEEVGL